MAASGSALPARRSCQSLDSIKVPSRKPTYDPTADEPSGMVRFILEQSGPIDEAEIERELLPLLYRHHPALEESSGRLKQEHGVNRLMHSGPSFFLTGPDAVVFPTSVACGYRAT